MTGSGVRPLDRPRGEQGKRPTAKAFKLAERDINMSEQEKQKSSFMEELDGWTEATIIGPLFASETDQEDWEPDIDRVKKAIRQKVLESYRNAERAGKPQPTPKPAAAPSGYRRRKCLRLGRARLLTDSPQNLTLHSPLISLHWNSPKNTLTKRSRV